MTDRLVIVACYASEPHTHAWGPVTADGTQEPLQTLVAQARRERGDWLFATVYLLTPPDEDAS